MTADNLILLLGGLALFLYGMHLLREKLERVFGGSVSKMIPLMQRCRAGAAWAGTAAAASLQSSTAVTVSVLGLVNTGVLSLACAAGAIIGANAGTSLTSLILSVAPGPGAALILAGMLIFMLFQREKIRQAGLAAVALGLVFIGMDMLGQAMAPLHASEWFTSLMLGIGNPLLAVLLGAGIAAVLQSSAVTVGMLQVMALQGLLPLQTAFYMVLGANIGTCITTLIASAGASVQTKRAATVHLLFNVLGAAVFGALAYKLPLIAQLEALNVNAKLQIALMHIVFNTATALVLLVLSPLPIGLSRVLVRGKEQKAECRMAHYDERMLAIPSLALHQLGKEAQRLIQINQAQMKAALEKGQGIEGEQQGAPTDDCAYSVKEITKALVRVTDGISGAQDSRCAMKWQTAATCCGCINNHVRQLMTRENAFSDNGWSEEVTDELACFAHQALGLLEMARQIAGASRLSAEMLQSAQLLTADAMENANELYRCFTQRLTEDGRRDDSGAGCLETLRDISAVVEHAAAMIDGMLAACA